MPPKPSNNQVTQRPDDCGNLSHDPACDLSHDLSATTISCDLIACDPGNITYDLPGDWSSTISHDKIHFGHAMNPLINTWKIVGMINKICPLTWQARADKQGLLIVNLWSNLYKIN